MRYRCHKCGQKIPAIPSPHYVVQCVNISIHDLWNFTLGLRVSNSLYRDVHSYDTRQKQLLHTESRRTVLLSNSFIYEGPDYWNLLPAEIKSSPAVRLFNNKLVFAPEKINILGVVCELYFRLLLIGL